MGVVIKNGRTRLRVAGGELLQERGRTTTAVPGAQIRSVEAGDGGLTVLLSDPGEPPMTIRHRNPQVLAAFAGEIRAIRPVHPYEGARPPVRRETAGLWPGGAARVRDFVASAHPLLKAAAAYVVVGVPVVALIPVEPRGEAVSAWLIGGLGFGLFALWAKLVGLRTRWIVRFRGVTVRVAPPDRVGGTADSEADYRYRFRTLDGRLCEHTSLWASHNGEIRYDPQDPSRVVVPTRIMWLFVDVALLVACGAPASGMIGIWLDWVARVPDALF
ncbi:hypothetical protein IPZ58_12685 [Streptomyces roseoverticillatus]|uniref:hypothetical protein n=1 Tax=Streptomyces roseoverticillatus TaxID=66429 RepID=UPI001F30FC6F|nr:hypothetical protein [Streptomyces roseoverticillatus]MCF3102434.1 hypothetical protein [Streptomyces roseoverticillatus]